MIVKVVACALAVLSLIGPARAACPTPPGGTNCVIGTPSVPTNAALKALTGMVAGNYVYRSGYLNTGDGGDAFYYWSASATCIDDGGSCIAPNTGSGRWLLRGTTAGVPGGPAASIKVFGAVCDGATDDSPAIRAALAALTTAFIPANSTCVVALHSNSDGIPLYSGYHLYGENTYTSTLQVLVYQTSTFPSFDFPATGKLVNMVVSQIFPPQPYLNTGSYSWSVQDPNPTTGGNGSLTGGATYYYKLTAVDAAGETAPSAYWHQTMQPGTTNSINLYLPFANIGDGTGFNVYASTTPTGTYFKQNSTVQAPNATFTFGTAANPFRTTSVLGTAPASNTTTVTVGDVNTAWSHGMVAGNTVAISGATPAGLNNASYSIQTVTKPDHFILHTTGVAAGTYTPTTNLPHVTGPSGIGTAVFYANNRDTGGMNHEITKVELDHFQIYDASTNIPVVLIDASGTYNFRVHHIDVKGPVSTSGIVGIRCSDASPLSNTVNGACFFYHFHDITGSWGTFLHLSINNNPAPVGPGPNAGAGMVDNIQGGVMIALDTTTVGSRGENGGGVFLQGYLSNGGDSNSYESYPGQPNGSHFQLYSCEGCPPHGDPNSWGFAGGAQFTINNATANLFGIGPPMAISGGLVATAQLPVCQGGYPATYYVTDAPTSPTPFTVPAGGGTFTRPVFCDGIGPNWLYY